MHLTHKQINIKTLVCAMCIHVCLTGAGLTHTGRCNIRTLPNMFW